MKDSGGNPAISILSLKISKYFDKIGFKKGDLCNMYTENTG